ncbi:MAG: hypothetical protein N0C84_12410, partial [Candidatus Thiodiazotropha taylori]|nr:hypothetical protein [Candidatus Thiodiazotropha taylori]MCW4257257.1 hypothetical protein [Candidatus Thiodiazotropha taylori]
PPIVEKQQTGLQANQKDQGSDEFNGFQSATPGKRHDTPAADQRKSGSVLQSLSGRRVDAEIAFRREIC